MQKYSTNIWHTSAFSVSVRLVAAVNDVTVSRRFDRSRYAAISFVEVATHCNPAPEKQSKSFGKVGYYTAFQLYSCVFWQRNTIPGRFGVKLKECLGLCCVCYAEGRAGRFNDRFHLFVIYRTTRLSHCTIHVLLLHYAKYIMRIIYVFQTWFPLPCPMESLAAELTYIQG